MRGKMVDFSAAAIDAYFDLEDSIVDDHTTLLAKVPIEEMTAVICNASGPVWATKNRKAVRSMCHTREAKMWLQFVNASILPTRHLNHVHLDRIALVYNIMKMVKINVGRIISGLIWLKARESTVKYLWFPTIITELCRLLGVVKTVDELVAPVGHYITEILVEKNVKVAEESSEIRARMEKLTGMRSEQSQDTSAATPITVVIRRSKLSVNRA
ncbi:hypothetical protein KSP40_PGU011032 [Platanthera guangdongensis]|uniref:Putative plant transposon protein domain-containing protein n=1 Tax=Platanthera guangdongensis TaxID=2320717 RepID=A0ABR2MVA4_9ASPA